MAVFQGFSEGKVRLTPIPAQFFTELLPEIDHLGELKVALYTIWRLDRMEGQFRFLRLQDYLEDQRFLQGLAPNPAQARTALEEALERAVTRGILLCAQLKHEKAQETYWFLNSPMGRAAIEAIRLGKWKPVDKAAAVVNLDMERPNIFRLYESNIGPLTPMIAEALRDAEQLYPADWIEAAVRQAVELNKRSWRYIEAILRSWKEKGRDEQDRGDTEKDRRRFIEGESADFFEH